MLIFHWVFVHDSGVDQAVRIRRPDFDIKRARPPWSGFWGRLTTWKTLIVTRLWKTIKIFRRNFGKIPGIFLAIPRNIIFVRLQWGDISSDIRS